MEAETMILSLTDEDTGKEAIVFSGEESDPDNVGIEWKAPDDGIYINKNEAKQIVSFLTYFFDL